MERGTKILFSTLLAIAILVPLASITKNGGGGRGGSSGRGGGGSMRSSGGGSRGLSGGGAARVSAGGAMRSSVGHSSGVTQSVGVSRVGRVSGAPTTGTRVAGSGIRRSGPISGVARPAGTSAVDRRVTGPGARRTDSTPAISTGAGVSDADTRVARTGTRADSTSAVSRRDGTGTRVAEADGARRGDGRRDGRGRRGDRRRGDRWHRGGDHRHGHGGRNWSNGGWGWWNRDLLWWGLTIPLAAAVWVNWPREEFYTYWDNSVQVINNSSDTVIVYSGGTPEIELNPGESAYMPAGLRIVIEKADGQTTETTPLQGTYSII